MSVSLCKAKYLTNLRLTHILSSNCQAKHPQIAKQNCLKLPSEIASNCQIEIVKYLIVSLMACFEKLAFFLFENICFQRFRPRN